MSDNHAIWVVASHHDGRIDAVVLELLGKAHRLAGQVHASVEAILIGHEVGPLAAALVHSGANVVRVLDHPALATFSTVRHARAIADAVARHRPQTLLLGADNENAALAARLAARLGTGLSAHCVDLKLERGLLVQTVPGFGGQVMANIVCPQQRPQMATVVAGVFSPVKMDSPDRSLAALRFPAPRWWSRAASASGRRSAGRLSRNSRPCSMARLARRGHRLTRAGRVPTR
jgi:electron transfer flavoprotein alpha subunit